MNREMPWLLEVPAPKRLDDGLVASCKTASEAIQLCWDSRRVRISQAHAAAELGIPPSHLSNILQGKKYLPDDLRIPFMWLCGNLALRQWEDAEMARLGIRAELAELKQRIAQLEAA